MKSLANFINENAFENVVCEMAAILSRSQCVKLAIHEIILSNIGSAVLHVLYGPSVHILTSSMGLLPDT